MNKTSIEWTDYTAGLIKSTHAGWPASFDEWEARRILRTRTTGKRILMKGDPFEEDVPDEMLDRMFAVFALRPDLTFMVLTKRPERMRAYLTKGPVKRYWNGLLAEWRELEDMPRDSAIAIAAAVMSVSRDGWVQPVEPTPWPLPNFWPGTSVENQATADERIPELLATPAAVRFLSCEPLLEGSNAPGGAEEAPVVRVFGEAGTFAGVGEVGSEGILRPVKVLQSGAGGLMSEPDSAQD